MFNRAAYSRPIPRTSSILAGLVTAVLLVMGGCPNVPPPGNGGSGDTISTDTTLTTLRITTSESTAVQNNAVITVSGDADIAGTLRADQGRLTLKVDGNLNVNGTLRSTGPAPTDDDAGRPLTAQPSGIFITVGAGSITFGPNAALISSGPIIITDDPALFDANPAELYNQVEDVTGDNISTLVPLPPDDSVFETERSLNKLIQPIRQQGAAEPITISGSWPPVGAAAPPGDQPVIIFRFSGNRPLNLDGWTVNGPAAPAADPVDQTQDPGQPATGKNGRRGLRLNITNNGGRINIVNDVVLNLADGGDGSSADAVCANATGGGGGASGNFRMSAADGIDLSRGTLTINPGRGGDGGTATVTMGPPGANGCPGQDGPSATAQGGAGAENRKRLFARGQVNGVENITIGPLFGGNGGDAIADACDGGDGSACCDGGDGGSAFATGGKGGEASLDVTGLGVATGLVSGGNGGHADAVAANGGDGGDCKFDDAGDGGRGGSATAAGGAGGSAANSAAGGAQGGNGGDAIASAGNGGDGGDSGFGLPGSGGAAGSATATEGARGSGSMPGQFGETETEDGQAGLDGNEIPVTLFCLPLPDFVGELGQPINPGTRTGPVTSADGAETIGTIDLEFVAAPQSQFQSSGLPFPHIGWGDGTIRVRVDSLQLETGQPGLIGGLRLAALFASGLTESNPLRIRALDASGNVIAEATLDTIPDNVLSPQDPETAEVAFEVDESVAVFELVAPPLSFVTLFRIYLLDP